MILDRYIKTCFCHYNITQNSFTVLKISVFWLFILSSPQPLATTDLFTVSMVVPFPECPIVGIKQYVPFSDGLRSLTNIHLSFLHVFF